jgi:hypothetical protein
MGDGLLLPSSSAGTFLQYNHIPAITRVTSTATAFQTSHKLVTGDYVEISGADQSEYNGIFRVTVIDDSHYTYTVTGTPATPATGVTSSYPISWSNWAAVTEITRAGTVATVHQPGNGFVTNDWVKIIGADQSQYNGLFKITRTDNNYYTFTVAGSPASPATGSIYSTLHSDWLGLALSPGTAFLQTANGELADVIISISISTRGTNLGAELSGQDWEARILPFISTWLESVVGQVLSGYVKDQYEELILDGINVIINSSYAFGLDKMGVVDSVTGFFQVFVGPTIYDGRFLITKLSNGKTFDVSYRKDGTPDLIDGTVPIITPQDLHFWKPGQICGKSVAFVGSLVTY